MDVLPVVLWLLELGVTDSVLSSIEPLPSADGFECTVALPPWV
jgi:hypothetical protein